MVSPLARHPPCGSPYLVVQPLAPSPHGAPAGRIAEPSGRGADAPPVPEAIPMYQRAVPFTPPEAPSRRARTAAGAPAPCRGSVWWGPPVRLPGAPPPRTPARRSPSRSPGRAARGRPAEAGKGDGHDIMLFPHTSPLSRTRRSPRATERLMADWLMPRWRATIVPGSPNPRTAQ